MNAYFAHGFGDPLDIAQGEADVLIEEPGGKRFAELLEEARCLIKEEDFFNWQVAFPGVWTEWEMSGWMGGFDAVIGNPPWDRIKLQQNEWFESRDRKVSMARGKPEREHLISEMEKSGDPLARDFRKASERAAAATRMARSCGDYPLLSGGDVNLYSLFVERAMTLAKPEGMIGLLVPSGIATGKTAAKFFSSMSTEGRLKALYDFENRRSRHNAPPFFADVHGQFKFCVFNREPFAN